MSNFFGVFGSNEKTSNIDVFKDPFKKDCINSVWMVYSHGRFRGWVEFTNGDTQGKQEFKANSFPELAEKMKEFINSL